MVVSLTARQPISLFALLRKVMYTCQQEICSRLINNERNRKSKNQTP